MAIRYLDPLPLTLPELSDDEYEFLIESRRVIRPQWESSPVRHAIGGQHRHHHVNRNCLTCGGEGVFRFWSLKAADEVVDYLCPCLDQWTLGSVLSAANINLELQRLGLADTVVDGATEDAVATYLSNPKDRLYQGGGLILVGDSGSGKTLLASLIMRAFLAQGYSAYLTYMKEVRGSKIKGWKDDDEKLRLDRKVNNVDLLVIDELAQGGRDETSTDFMVETFAELLHDRQTNGRITFILSQHDTKQLALKYRGSEELLRSLDIHHIRREPYHAEKKHRDAQEHELGLRRPVVLK